MRKIRLLLLAAVTAAMLWLPVGAQQQPLRVFIRAGEKTHGAAGNDQHDYPRFLTEWTKLLTARGAKVEGALRFPTAGELARTDVLIVFKGDGGTCSPTERGLLESYTGRGGGLVILHDGMCSDDPAWFATVAGGAKKHGEMNWSRGVLKMRFADSAHPITKGLADFEVDDEAFFLLTKAPAMHVLATTPLPSNGEVTPQVWTYERTAPGGQPYRSFVSMLGHYYKIFSEPTHQAMVLRGIAWAGKRDADLLRPVDVTQTNGQAAGQPRPAAPQQGGGRGGPLAGGLFAGADADKDGGLTRPELNAAFDRWFTLWDTTKTGSVTQEQLQEGLTATLVPFFGAPGPGRGTAQNQTPNPSDVQAMMAALPEKAPAKPKQPRQVLVLGRAAGFVHSSIPIAARTIAEMGKKTGAWSTTITYDAADINEQNLKQYDAIFLASTTGNFLDDPNDASATAARRKALLDFVRNGKGLAGIHAASDAYHQNAPGTGRGTTPAGGRGGRGGGRGGGMFAPLVQVILDNGDMDGDRRVTRAEFLALGGRWYESMDPDGTGRVNQQQFSEAFAALMPPPQPQRLGPTGFPIQAPATELGPDTQVGTWPEFNRMIGGFFKFHWNDGQLITYKIDEPNHPLNAPFKTLKEPFQIVDETYTFGRDTYSRENLRVLTSVDYDKMSPEDKAKEQFPRADGDYALSWIRREGKGRVFYEAHGHNEKVYANPVLLEHVLYGMQYVLGDLPADDSPSVK
jgi:type 1 glutamine amidotransferase